MISDAEVGHADLNSFTSNLGQKKDSLKGRSPQPQQQSSHANRQAEAVSPGASSFWRAGPQHAVIRRSCLLNVAEPDPQQITSVLTSAFAGTYPESGQSTIIHRTAAVTGHKLTDDLSIRLPILIIKCPTVMISTAILDSTVIQEQTATVDTVVGTVLTSNGVTDLSMTAREASPALASASQVTAVQTDRTLPDQFVVGLQYVGSNFAWFNLNTNLLATSDYYARLGFEVLPNYLINKAVIDQDLIQMRENGQNAISLPIWFTTEAFDLHEGTFDCQTGTFTASGLANLTAFLAEVKNLGFQTVEYRAFPLLSASPFNWTSWDPTDYTLDYSVLQAITNVAQSAGIPYTVDLSNEGMPVYGDAGQAQVLMWDQKIWAAYSAQYGTANTVGFSTIPDFARIESMTEVYGNVLPSQFDFHDYGVGDNSFSADLDAGTTFNDIYNQLEQLGLGGRPWIIGETFYNDPVTAQLLAQASVLDDQPVSAIYQWQLDSLDPISADGSGGIDIAPPLDANNYADLIPTSGSTLTIGDGPDNLDLSISGIPTGAYPQFDVFVDGVQVGGTRTAIASYRSGSVETLDVTGTLSSGQHEISIVGVNAQGNQAGSAGPDLYLVGATLNGVGLQGDSGSIVGTGSISIFLGFQPIIYQPQLFVLTAGQSSSLAGISIFEVGALPGETFNLSISDKSSEFSATGDGITGSGTNSLTITGSLAEVNNDLLTLSGTEFASGSEVANINLGDSLGNFAVAQTATMEIASSPILTEPVSVSTVPGTSSVLGGVSLSETGAIVGETFTVELSDGIGVLSATGLGVSGSGGLDVHFSGSIAQINTDMATLTYETIFSGSDTVRLFAQDSIGNIATGNIIVTAAPRLAASSLLEVGRTDPISRFRLFGPSSTVVPSVTVCDSAGVLEATGVGVISSNNNTISVSGSLAQVNQELQTVLDTPAGGADGTGSNAGMPVGNTQILASAAIEIDSDQAGTALISEGDALLAATVQFGTVTVSGMLSLAGISTFGSLAETGSAASTIIANSDSLTVSGSAVMGSLTASNGSHVQLGSNVSISSGVTVDGSSQVQIGTSTTWNGWLIVSAGATLTGSGQIAANADIRGTVVCQGLTFDGFLGGGGNVDIGAGGASVGAVGSGQVLDFATSGAGLTIEAGSLASMQGTLTGFAAGDTIDIAATPIVDVAFAALSAVCGEMMLFGPNWSEIGTLSLSGNMAAYSAVQFGTDSDGDGGSDIFQIAGTSGTSTSPRNLIWSISSGGTWNSPNNWGNPSGQVVAAAPTAVDMATITGGTTSISISGIGAAATVLINQSVLLGGAFQFGTVTVSGMLSLAGISTFGSLAETGSAASTIIANSDSLTVSGSAVMGSLTASNGSHVQLGSNVSISSGVTVDGSSQVQIGTSTTWNGWLIVSAGATLTGSGQIAANADIRGTVVCQGLTFDGFLGGGGNVDIGAGGASVGAVGSGQVLDFATSGTGLTIEAGSLASMQGTLTGFAAGDAIDIAGTPIVGATYKALSASTGLLQLLNTAGIVVASLSLSGNAIANSTAVFATWSDGNGGTKIFNLAASQNDAAYLWKGGPTTTWNTPSNWLGTNGLATTSPDGSDVVTVTGSTGAPLVISGPGVASSVVINQSVLLGGAFQFGTVTVSGMLSLAGISTFGSLAETGSAASTIIANSDSLTVSGSAVMGSLTASNGSHVQLGSNVSISSGVTVDGSSQVQIGTSTTWNGWLIVSAGATLTGSGQIAANADIRGTVVCQGLTFDGFLGGGGNVDIGAGGASVGAVGSGQVLDFATSGTGLTIEAGSLASMQGTLTGFAAGDAIDIAGTPIVGATYKALSASTGLLQLLNTAGIVVASLSLSGNAIANSTAVFATWSDGNGGTKIFNLAASQNDAAYLWKGGPTTTWNTPSNWLGTNGLATTSPDGSDVVTVTGSTGAPLVISGPGVASSVVINQSVLLGGAFQFGTVTVSGMLSLAGISTFGSLAETGSAASTIIANSDSLTVSGSAVMGSLTASNGSHVQLGSNVSISSGVTVDGSSQVQIGTSTTWNGWLIVSAGATLTGSGQIAANADIRGTVVCQGLTFDGFLGGGGNVDIGAGGASVGTVSSGQVLDFATSGAGLTIEAGSLASMQGTLTGFAAGDTIDIAGTPIVGATYKALSASTGLLQLLNTAGIVVASLSLSGNAIANSTAVFATWSDGNGGTKIFNLAASQNGAAYLWKGGPTTTWNTPSNWLGTNGLATTSPDGSDVVTVTGSTGAPLVISGPGVASSVVINQSVLLGGAFQFGTVTVSGMLSLAGISTFGSLAETGSAASTIIANSDSLTVSGSAVMGSLTASNGSHVQLGSNVSISSGVTVDGSSQVQIGTSTTWNGWLIVSAGATLTGSGQIAANADIRGTVVCQGLTFDGFLGGGGNVDIGAGGASVGAVGSGQVLDFATSGTGLTIEAGSLASMQGTLTGFAAGDTIDIAGILASSATYISASLSTGKISISDATGVLLGNFQVSGPNSEYTALIFNLQSDGHGGTLLTEQPRLAAFDQPAAY